jgi:hypothetical protein
MAHNDSRFKKVAFSLVMAGMALSVCYVIFEFGLGTFYYSDATAITDKEYDEVLGWRLKTGSYLVKPPQAFRKVRIEINASHLRGAQIGPDHQDSVRQIIVLGDSFTFAKVIREDDLFSTLLESHLVEAGQRVVVVNAGVPGYGNAQELLLMRRLADRGVVGDIYILMLFTNDILDNLRLGYGDLREDSARPGFELSSDGTLALVHPPRRAAVGVRDDLAAVTRGAPGMKGIAVLRSRLESWIQTKPGMLRTLKVLGIRVPFPRIPGVLNGWYSNEVLDPGVPLMTALVREIRDEAASRGSNLLVGIIPSPIQIYPEVYGPILRDTFPGNPLIDEWLRDPTRPQTIMKRICENMAIPVLDLYPVLRAHDHQVLFIPREGHFTEEAHEIVALELAKTVLYSGRLD